MPTLTSNGVGIPFDAAHFAPLPDSAGLLDDPAALRRRYRRDGYVYLRGFLDVEMLRRLRHEYFAAFDRSYLRAGHAVDEGIFSGTRPPTLAAHGTTDHPAHAFVRGQGFARLAHDPGLATVASTLLDSPCRLLPRQIVRHFDRSTPRASRAHRDHRYLDAGSDRLVTVWIPVADAPLATGGLIYLEDSAAMESSRLDNLRAVSDRPGDTRPISHDLAWVAERLGRRWRWADFRAGDIAVHSPHVVHASLDTTTDAMRLSADIRFLAAGEPADPRWLEAWSGDDGY